MAKRRKKRGRLNRRGRLIRRLVTLLVLAVIGAAGAGLYQLWQSGMLPANQTASEWYEVTEASKALVKFPDDDGPHEDLTEWWYYNGHLESEDGRHYSFHVALFLINRLASFTIAHAALLDHDSGEFYTTQLRTGGIPNEAPPRQGFDFRLGQWQVSGANGQDQVRVEVPEFSLILDLLSTAEPILHGETGLVSFEGSGDSYYYSRPRMTVTGSAGAAGEIAPVTGEAWFDHQWGNFSVNSLGWNWFALQLKDGTDLMLFELFNPDDGSKVVHFGTLSRGSELLHTLDEADFVIEPMGNWRSPDTAIVYPMGWTVSIPSLDLALTLDPVSEACEIDGRQTSYMVYWEGAVKVKGGPGGRGFVELSGYKAL